MPLCGAQTSSIKQRPTGRGRFDAVLTHPWLPSALPLPPPAVSGMWAGALIGSFCIELSRCCPCLYGGVPAAARTLIYGLVPVCSFFLPAVLVSGAGEASYTRVGAPRSFSRHAFLASAGASPHARPAQAARL